MVLHGNRDVFTRLPADFVAGQPFWADPHARAMFELDLLARPYVYRERPTLPADYPFTELRVEQRDDGVTEISGPAIVTETLRELDAAPGIPDGPLLLHHPFRRKMPFRTDRPLRDNIAYCQGMTVHLRAMLPEWAAAHRARQLAAGV